MNKLPTVLFNGTPLMQHAHSLTAKVQKTVSAAAFEYLSAEPIEALIQRLYTENEIILPYLRRDQISYEHFESYLAPYIEAPVLDRLGQRSELVPLV
jgi:hypothetical protein